MSETILEDLLQTLRAGKQQLRMSRRNLPLPEKVTQVVELQRIVLPIIARRRPLEWWEQVWDLGDNR